MIIRGQAIIDFLEGKSEDYRGRTFNDIISSGDKTLEQCHDAIQQIFPLHEESKHANTYPIVDKDVIEKASKSDTIKSNLRLAKDRFERFYGIGQYDDVDKQRKWCGDHNHNLLRVTRIIRSLRLFGLEKEALDFHDKVMQVGNHFGISNKTADYWDKALLENMWESLQ